MISIFIPTYNGEKYLAKTLESLLAQSYRDFEVLCVDDSSADSSFSILTQYGEKDPRIKAFQKPHDGDVPHSWQFVFPLIKGEFTLYMSQDDLLAPDSLEKLVLRQEETRADAVLPIVVDYEERKSIDEVHSYQGVDGDISIILSGHEAFQLMLDYEISGFALWKTSIVKKVGMRTESYNSDELAQREWVVFCEKVAFSDALFYYRRDNMHAITRTFSTRNLFRPLTDARLLELAIKNNLNPELIQTHRNEYYQNLWWSALYFMLHKENYTTEEKFHLRSAFNKAYAILHGGVSLKKWYYQLSSRGVFLFWIALDLKCLLSKYRNRI
ncbi:MAG: glycosyltransferase family 2 protein [Paludibacteraceae bacterium]|nr:glycosyltransferase family 2 protein [Paludibacteraceae bacterium]